MNNKKDKSEFLEEIKEYLGLAEKKKYSSGDMIFEEGKEDKSFYVVLSGDIEISKKTTSGDSKVIAQVECGEILGEGVLSGKTIKPATAKALTDVEMLELSLDRFEDLKKENPDSAIKFLLIVLEMANGRLIQTNSKLLAIYEMSELTDAYGDDLKNLSSNLIEKLITITESKSGALLLKNPFAETYRTVYTSDDELNENALEGTDIAKTQKLNNDKGKYLIVDLKGNGSLILMRDAGSQEYDSYNMRTVILIADLVANNIKEASEHASEKAKKLLHRKTIEF